MTKRILLLLALTTASLRADLEFSGFFITPDEALFSLSDTDGGASSGWLRMGDAFQACTLKAFDREHEVLTVVRDGRDVALKLREPRVKDGRMTIDGAITLWPSGQKRNVHASLFLGEEEAFPLAQGATLHLTAERRPDGNLLYHPRLVTRDGAGRESSQDWPFILTPPGGEFSLRIGDLGFSFKP